MSVNVDDLKYLMSFCEPPITPRRYSTQATNDGQYVANTFEEMLRGFEESSYVDCRINIYNYLGKHRTFEAQSVNRSDIKGHSLQTDLGYAHVYANGHASYHYDIASSLYRPLLSIPVAERVEESAKLIQIKALAEQAPTIIFTDLDDRKALNATRKRIKDVFMDEELEPTVIDSGNGLNLLLKLETDPAKYPVPVDDQTENDMIPGRTLLSARTFALIYDYNPANISPGSLLMRCASEVLTRKKADKGNHPSVRSCMVRVPGSYNGKLKRKGIDKQVSILNRGSWDQGRKGHVLFLLLYFRGWLKEQKEKRDKSLAQARKKRISRQETKVFFGQRYFNPEIAQLHYWYIEIMLRSPFDDFRRRAVALVLAPYLLRIKQMPIDIAEKIILQWLAACDKVRYLEFDPEEKTAQALRYARDCNYLPLEFDSILKYDENIHAKLLRLQANYLGGGRAIDEVSVPPSKQIGGN